MYILLIGFIIFIIFWDRLQKKSTYQKLLSDLEASYGKIPTRKYSHDEFEKISHYYLNNGSVGIDDITWNDLEMDEVFKRINSATSSVGEEVLYDMLRTPILDTKTLTKRKDLISFFSIRNEERRKTQAIFATCGRTKKSISDSILQFNNLEPIHFGLDMLQAFGLLACIVGIFIKPSIFIYLLILMIVINILTYYRKKSKFEASFLCINYRMKLAWAVCELDKLHIVELDDYLTPLLPAAKKVLKSRRLQFLIGNDGSVTDSISAFFLDYLRMLFHIDIIAFSFLQKRFKEDESQAWQMFKNLGFIESCIVLSSFRESLPYFTVPVVKEEVNLCADGLYHPLLSAPIANDIHTAKAVLLTGSNASGKSTFLKTVAINAIFAQTIGTVCATSYESCLFQIYSSMSLRDHLDKAESYYITEVKALKRILDHRQDATPLLCFVDEVLRGTNTVERIAASARILQSLAEGNGLCFAATHDIELTYLLEKDCDNYYFQEEILGNDISFPYKLHKGRAKSKNAIKLLEILGYDKEIVEGASLLVSHFLKFGDWSI